MHLRTIVCLVDFSDLSRQGLALGMDLASRFSAAVIAFHASHLSSDQLEGSDYPQSRPWYAETLARAGRQMDALVTAHPAIIPMVVGGEPVAELIKLTAANPIDLVIAPSRGISALRRLFTGTLVERLVRRITCPVLVCRPKARARTRAAIHRVVAGICETEHAGPVMVRAVAAARAFDADLEIVHVCKAPPDLEEEPYELAQHHLEQRIRDHLLETARRAGADANKTRVTVLTGTPAEAIGEFAARAGADLVVVGVRRIGTVAKTVIGSTTEALLRAGSCCLLTLPADGQ